MEKVKEVYNHGEEFIQPVENMSAMFSFLVDQDNTYNTQCEVTKHQQLWNLVYK